ncbi:MAG: FAD-dependent oxidoreductase [Solirubrobacterales bacterium]
MTTTQTSAGNGNQAATRPEERVRVVICGAGFSGLGMAIRLRRMGIEDFVVLERARDLGGTWRDNSYPGCACDVPSHLYSFSFAPNPDWSRTYSYQPEIWRYLRDVAERFGVTRHIRYHGGLREASWNPERQLWEIEADDGRRLCAENLVDATGGLSKPRVPAIPGLERFEGRWYHSAEWDHGHDLTGRRVAVVGTGASAIQIVPAIQPQVGTLTIYQRTPPWVVPRTDRDISALERRIYRLLPAAQLALRAAIYWGRESLAIGFRRADSWPGRIPQAIARWQLRRQVRDKELRAKITPSYQLGCKRLLPSNEYYPALAEPNVELIAEAVTEVRPRSIVAADGSKREIDTIVFATGFEILESPATDRIRGGAGRSLAEVWAGSPQAYLGTTIAGFPNLFRLLGPNSALGHNSVVFMIESQINYVAAALRTMDELGLASVEVRADAQQSYNHWLERRLEPSVWNAGGCASWYLDRSGRNQAIWPGLTWPFRRRTRRFDPGHYTLIRRNPLGQLEKARLAGRPAAALDDFTHSEAPANRLRQRPEAEAESQNEGTHMLNALRTQLTRAIAAMLRLSSNRPLGQAPVVVLAAVVLAALLAQVALAGGSDQGPRASASAVSNKKFKKLKRQVAALQQQLEALQRQSGPQGAQGIQGQQGAQGPAGTAPACAGNGSGDTMVAAGSVCIDRYEVSVWSSPTGGTQYGTTMDNYPAACTDTGQGCKAGTAGEIYARSVPGAPSRFITLFQAQQALANSGKRLPPNAEWQQAVAGTPDSTACNVSTGLIANTGANPGCVSNFGANDMVGNLYEWVADWVPASTDCPGWGAFSNDQMCLSGASTTAQGPGALIRGGDFSSGAIAGPFTVDGFNFRPSNSSSSIGFRGAR